MTAWPVVLRSPGNFFSHRMCEWLRNNCLIFDKQTLMRRNSAVLKRSRQNQTAFAGNRRSQRRCRRWCGACESRGLGTLGKSGFIWLSEPDRAPLLELTQPTPMQQYNSQRAAKIEIAVRRGKERRGRRVERGREEK